MAAARARRTPSSRSDGVPSLSRDVSARPYLVTGRTTSWLDNTRVAGAPCQASAANLSPITAEWGVIERVSTGLLCIKIDLQPVGRQMLTVADRIAE
jgi:hypothetical protein